MTNGNGSRFQLASPGIRGYVPPDLSVHPSVRLTHSELAIVGAAVTAWVGLTIAAGMSGLWKLLIISVFSGGSMIIGSVLGLHRYTHPRALTWATGIAAGLMLTASSAFLLPIAIGRGDAQIGGFGVAAGLIAGFALHGLADRIRSPVASLDDAVVRLIVHTFSAGIVIGVIYSALPGVGLLLGMTIVAHKGPAGYAAAHRLHQDGRSVIPLLIPSAGVGIPAIALGLLGLTIPGQASAVVFGIAAGIFLDVAISFLPAREDGADAVASVLAGAAVVAIAWAMITMPLL